MPQIVDIRKADDPLDAIQRAARILQGGGLIGIPTETAYAVVASAGQLEAVQRLVNVARSLVGDPPVLVVRDLIDAQRIVSGVGPIGRKFLSRCWPGPVTLCFGSSGEPHDAATISSTGTLVIADVVRQALGPDGVRMRMSAHPVPQTLVDHLSDPLVFSGEEPANGKPLQTASELVARTGTDLELVLDDGPSRFGGLTTVVRADKSSWSVLREGVVSARTIARLACDVYLFVCTGNTCRSPMAEALFRKLLADRLGCSEDALVDRGYVIESAGISAVLGCPPSPDAVETLRARGVNLHSHASQPLTERLLQHADYIFTMTHSHRESILWEHPEMAERVQVLARDNSDIPDPIGMGQAEYKRCADEIERHLRRILVEHVA